jgi:hypothetical protein
MRASGAFERGHRPRGCLGGEHASGRRLQHEHPARAKRAALLLLFAAAAAAELFILSVPVLASPPPPPGSFSVSSGPGKPE